MKLNDLMSLDDLEIELQEGYVRERKHPLGELTILNYTEKAQFERRWNPVTSQCRGLIVNSITHEVLARPFAKFFNYGEHPEGSLPLDAWATVTDKLDGSLGILYPAPDGWAIATRGSFESEQAIWATKHLRERYTVREPAPCIPKWEPEPGLTYLFEIIYPENRIVLDYGSEEALVLLGTRDIEGGGYCTAREYDAGWPGELAEQLEARTLREALALEPRPNAEGVVVLIHEAETMVKIKQDDYVRLHRLVTGLNERAVWEHMANDEKHSAMGLIRDTPEEFHPWIIRVANDLSDRAVDLYGQAWAAYGEVLQEVGRFAEDILEDRELRKAYAERAREHGELTPLLFQLLDGRDISPAIWKTLKPKGETPSLMNRSEDNA